MSEKDTGRVQRNPYADFLMVFLSHEGPVHALQPATKMQQHVYYVFAQGIPIDLTFKNFDGGWSHRYPIPITYQNSRLSEAKQVGHKSYCCINRLGTVNYPYQLRNGRNRSKTREPNKSYPYKQTLLIITASGLLC